MRYELVRRILHNLCHLVSLRLDDFDWMGFMGMLRVDPDTGDLRDAMAAFFPFPELKWLSISNIQLRSSHELTLFISLFPQLSRLDMLQVMAPFIPETLLPLPEPPHDACEDLPPTGEMGTHLRMLVVNFLNGPRKVQNQHCGIQKTTAGRSRSPRPRRL